MMTKALVYGTWVHTCIWLLKKKKSPFVCLSSNQVSGWVLIDRSSALWAHLGCSVCWGWCGRAGTVLCPVTKRTRALSEWSSTRSSWMRWKGRTADAAAWGCDSGLITHTHSQMPNQDQWHKIHTHSVHQQKRTEQKKKDKDWVKGLYSIRQSDWSVKLEDVPQIISSKFYSKRVTLSISYHPEGRKEWKK